jgi:AraC family transcriptional regulator, regulatory protein of adaptative response / methylated-DNA-[protein]-cysteine methyltransferase
VLTRDRRYDGVFVYAVRSTGIYCRPSCPSRRPRRTQVTFFPVPEAAEQAGFRACRRCRPKQSHPPGNDPRSDAVQRVCRFLDEHPDAPATLASLARQVGITTHQLHRAFTRLIGITPREYREAARVRRLQGHLKRRHHVSPAVYEAGYGSSSRVYERADALLGMTPATYARGGKGARIAYAVVPCPLGLLLVAETARGVCRVALGDRITELEAGLRAEFPAAEIRRDTAALGGAAAAVLAYLEGREPAIELPLDIRATAFQRLVWKALLRIPFGATRSYQAVARAIGRPAASRAVARACATNPVALIIPCHRVVREDGEAGGYRWGLERKRALLAREREADITASGA